MWQSDKMTSPTGPSDVRFATDRATRARLWWEIGIVLAVTVGQSALYSVLSLVRASLRTTPIGQQMKAALLSTYIAYSGPCTINETEGSVTLKVEAAWRPDYVGTEQKRFFRFDNGKLLFGPAPSSIRGGSEPLTRRLTLEREALR